MWLKRSGKRYWYTLLPMVFILGITFWSLVLQAQQAFAANTTMIQTLNGVVSLLLLALASALLWYGGRALLSSDSGPAQLAQAG